MKTQDKKRKIKAAQSRADVVRAETIVEDEVIVASGTSEGVRKAWVVRKRNNPFDVVHRVSQATSAEHAAQKFEAMHGRPVGADEEVVSYQEHDDEEQLALEPLGKARWQKKWLKEEDKMEKRGYGLIGSDNQKSDATVTAAGTSEGAKKGWAKRIGGLTADQHMDKFAHFSDVANLRQAPSLRDVYNSMANAHHKTALAIKTDHPQDHYKAAVAHHGAADSAKLVGDEAAEKDHRKFAAGHDERGEALDPEGKHAHATDATPSDVVHCRSHSSVGPSLGASQPWLPGERVEFMWMPAGVHTITAGFRKGSIELTVLCDESTASAVQASLDAWREDRPKQEPFGCIEHKEQEASFRVGASGGFAWRNDGVYLAAEPTTLGAENVNGKVHRSWSPSFTTDADYASATESGGVLRFPDGARGSRSNPARITGVDFCVGTLTNKPAFHAMSPVKGSEDETVTAAGPEHYHHIAKNASELSAKANREGIAATRDFTVHRSATELHRKAASAHNHAADYAPDATTAAVHRRYARVHEGLADRHSDWAESEEAKEGAKASEHNNQQDNNMEETVTAVGTSEGVKKGWIARHQGAAASHEAATRRASFDKNQDAALEAAHTASMHANLASAYAEKEQTPEGHRAAAEAHHSARRAAMVAQEMTRSPQLKAYLDTMAVHHYGKHEGHFNSEMALESSKAARASDTSESPDAIYARIEAQAQEQEQATEQLYAAHGESEVELVYARAEVQASHKGANISLKPFGRSDWYGFSGAEAHDKDNPPHYGEGKSHYFVVDKHGIEAGEHGAGGTEGQVHRLDMPFHAAKHFVSHLSEDTNNDDLKRMGFTRIM